MKSFDWRNMELRDFFGLVAIGILLFTVILDFVMSIEIMLKRIKRNSSLCTWICHE